MNEDSQAKEFEESRRALMESYNTQTITHGGYVIALVIGLLSMIAQFSALSESSVGKWFFWCVLVEIPFVAVYVILRTIFWAFLSNDVLSISRTNLRGGDADPLILRIHVTVVAHFNEFASLRRVPFTYFAGHRATLGDRALVWFIFPLIVIGLIVGILISIKLI